MPMMGIRGTALVSTLFLLYRLGEAPIPRLVRLVTRLTGEEIAPPMMRKNLERLVEAKRVCRREVDHGLGRPTVLYGIAPGDPLHEVHDFVEGFRRLLTDDLEEIS